MPPLGMRSWHDYDEALIERGCAILDLGSLTSWREELEAMNSAKLGRPYEFPNSYISFLAFVKVGFDIPYRTLEGITRELEEYVRFVEEMHYTHMRRRILASMKGKKPSEIVGADADGDEPMTIIADSSGLSVSNKGSYIEDKWKKEKRKYVKLHILADKKTGKIKGFRVTSEKTGDNAKFVPMVKEVAKKKRVAKVYADAAYDARKNFNLLGEIGAEPAIKLRKNASFKLMGSRQRRDEAIILDALGYEGWKSVKDYGKRWLVEITFSAFKRVLGEALRARRFLSQKAEASLKVMLYNRFLSIRP
ncbi:MAG: IS5 family transposase [Thaumarchaeota archaeon]|nr:IS5 family transposase [Nitrososphaerota archaeon]